MTNKDQELIRKAHLSNIWEEVCEMEEMAETEEAKDILKDRRMHLYHREEYLVGIL